MNFQKAAAESYLIMTVIAVDSDPGENGHVTYHFKHNNQIVQQTNEFIIDENTGDLTNKIFSDYEVGKSIQVLM